MPSKGTGNLQSDGGIGLCEPCTKCGTNGLVNAHAMCHATWRILPPGWGPLHPRPGVATVFSTIKRVFFKILCLVLTQFCLAFSNLGPADVEKLLFQSFPLKSINLSPISKRDSWLTMEPWELCGNSLHTPRLRPSCLVVEIALVDGNYVASPDSWDRQAEWKLYNMSYTIIHIIVSYCIILLSKFHALLLEIIGHYTQICHDQDHPHKSTKSSSMKRQNVRALFSLNSMGTQVYHMPQFRNLHRFWTAVSLNVGCPFNSTVQTRASGAPWLVSAGPSCLEGCQKAHQWSSAPGLPSSFWMVLEPFWWKKKPLEKSLGCEASNKSPLQLKARDVNPSLSMVYAKSGMDLLPTVITLVEQNLKILHEPLRCEYSDTIPKLDP